MFSNVKNWSAKRTPDPVNVNEISFVSIKQSFIPLNASTTNYNMRCCFVVSLSALMNPVVKFVVYKESEWEHCGSCITTLLIPSTTQTIIRRRSWKLHLSTIELYPTDANRSKG